MQVRYANSSWDHTIPATMVTEGGGIGWMLHPNPYATNEPCDYVVPAGQHCTYVLRFWQGNLHHIHNVFLITFYVR